MSKVYLVPSIDAKGANYMMYCNWARMNPYEERCVNCTNNCEHAGKHTILEKK